jgi:hypothetical protein
MRPFSGARPFHGVTMMDEDVDSDAGATPDRGGARGLPRKEQPVKSKEFDHVND